MRKITVIKKDGSEATVNLRRLAVAGTKPATQEEPPAEPAADQTTETATDAF